MSLSSKSNICALSGVVSINFFSAFMHIVLCMTHNFVPKLYIFDNITWQLWK